MDLWSKTTWRILAFGSHGESDASGVGELGVERRKFLDSCILCWRHIHLLGAATFPPGPLTLPSGEVTWMFTVSLPSFSNSRFCIVTKSFFSSVANSLLSLIGKSLKINLTYGQVRDTPRKPPGQHSPASENEGVACVGVIGDVGSVDIVTANTAGGFSAAAKQATTPREKNGSS